MNEIPFTAAANLTRDPELRFTPQGKPVASLALAVTARRYDPDTKTHVDGETTFLDATVWGPQAEHAAATLGKGDRAVVIGRWVTRVFTPQTGRNAGEQIRKLEIVVDEIGPSLRWATAQVTRNKPARAAEDRGEEHPL